MKTRERDSLLRLLEARFAAHAGRHASVAWADVRAGLVARPAALETLRRSLCCDRDARDTRKENKPAGNAVDAAAAMGVELLTEEQYRALQALGAFDVKTSSWIRTPPDVRARGGSRFCDRRYGRVFVYPNGAASYDAARGFRGRLRV